MEIHGDAHAGHGLLYGGDALDRGLQLVIGVDPAQLVRAVHLHSLVALRCGDLCLVAGIARMVAADPAVDLDPIAAFAAQKVIDRHAERLALDIPHGLLDTGDGAGQDGAAAVEAGAVHLLEGVLDIGGTVADKLIAQFPDGGGHAVGLALAHRLTPADEAVVRGHFEKQPARRYFKKL